MDEKPTETTSTPPPTPPETREPPDSVVLDEVDVLKHQLLSARIDKARAEAELVNVRIAAEQTLFARHVKERYGVDLTTHPYVLVPETRTLKLKRR